MASGMAALRLRKKMEVRLLLVWRGLQQSVSTAHCGTWLNPGILNQSVILPAAEIHSPVLQWHVRALPWLSALAA